MTRRVLARQWGCAPPLVEEYPAYEITQELQLDAVIESAMAEKRAMSKSLPGG